MLSSELEPAQVRLQDLPALCNVLSDAGRRRQCFENPDLQYLFWECTLKCNLKCGHCGSSCTSKSPLPELTTAQITSILEGIAEDFDATRIIAAITGGEPLLRRDLDEVVATMYGLGILAGIVTNGTLLTRERAARLVDVGLQTTSISLDGFGATHDAMRGEGTYAKVLAGVTAAREAGLPTVEVITCVRPDNLYQLRDIERVVREAGAHCWRLITIDRMGRQAGEKNADTWLEPPQVRTLLDFVARRRAEGVAEADPFTIGFSCGGFLGVRREHAVRGEDSQCYAGLCVASILCDGQVSACPSLPRSWAQGSALEHRFSHIWQNAFKPFRDLTWRHEGVCDGCEWFGICGGGGLHERLAQPQEFCWLHRQRG